ncbi:MAG: DUF4159 domain-containing protein [Planctomycetia bacterium]|nr:DUF4159 domain-containing protein [Planctomycetia bacterium]
MMGHSFLRTILAVAASTVLAGALSTVALAQHPADQLAAGVERLARRVDADADKDAGRDPNNKDSDINPAEFRRSIERAIAFLKREQKPDGGWTSWPGFQGGETGLCTLALIEAGVPTKDPAVQRALKHLRSITPERTYDVALQTMALCRAGEAADLPTIRRNAQLLERTQQSDGDGRGAWGYPQEAGGRVDNSNTQFALLALYDAEQAGVKINPEVWKQALIYWERTKNGRGSWGYVHGAPSTGSMTSAGISSMIIASASASPDDARADQGGCQCVNQQQSEAVENALAWLGDNFNISHNPQAGERPIDAASRSNWNRHYYLYGLERAGRLAARRFFVGGARAGQPRQYDWFREGANLLLHSQDAAGGWSGLGPGEAMEHVSTSFALLFLAKGRRPVLISKLQRPGNDWNLLRHDLAHLTAYAEKKWKLPMTWQIIDGRTATLGDYCQTPVLFLSGRDRLVFANDEQKHLLRAYVEEGGFIFADACCEGAEFAESFKQLMRDVFPEPQLALKPLEPDHPIWSIEEKVKPQFVDPKTRWLWGIDVGCRTSVVLCTGNVACYWELDRAHRDPPLAPAVADELEACRAIGINVLAYATNRNLKKKEEVPRDVQMADTHTQSKRGHLAIAKLKHAGGCDDAPRALTNLLEALAKGYELHVDPKAPLLEITDESLFNYHFVFLHGRNDFRLSQPEVDQLKKFVERGGMIFGDSLCASPAFAEAFRREMRRVVPAAALARIPMTDPIFTTAYGGQDITHVTRREAVRHRQGEPLEIKLRNDVEPVLEGAKVGERYVVIFSPFDISCALEHQAAPQCHGYIPEDAARIAINVLLYSLHE